MSNLKQYDVSGTVKGVSWLYVKEKEGLVRVSQYFTGEFEELVKVVNEYNEYIDPYVSIYEEEIEFVGYRPLTDEDLAAIEKSKRKVKQKDSNAKQKKIDAAMKLLKEEGLL